MVPLQYILRNFKRRRLRTALTTIGIALVVAVYFLMSSVADTMVRTFHSTGAPDEVVIVQAGALSVDFSNIDRASLTYVETLDGVASEGNRQLVSPELVLGTVVATDGRGHKVSVRGVRRRTLSVYQQVQLASGDWPGPGRRAAIGSALAAKLRVDLGDTIAFESDQWQVMGLLDAGGRVYDQEIWVDLDELAAASNRKTYSSYTLRATAAAAVPAIIETINEGRRFPLGAQTAANFYARTGGMATWMGSIGRLIALIVAIGAVLGGMNTMYSAVAGRRREIGTLRSIGFSRQAILAAFLLESVLIAVVAGILGLVIGAAISWLPFELPFVVGGAVSVGPVQAVWSLVLAVIVGLLGGGLPALNAARTRIVEALR